jgi:DNA-binding CsgD family transcriptional regulator
MKMSMSNLHTEPELVVQSRKAAYCARRRLNGPDLTPQDMEDMIQTAALAYWKHHREGRPPAFCFVCARTAAEKYFFRQILGRNPRNPLSLDVPVRDGGDLPHEWLPSPTPANGRTLRLDWLSDEVLEGVLFEARHAAGFSKRQMTRYWDTIQTDKRIIRLAARGHTNASIAQQMDTTEGTIRNRRQRIRRLLETLLPAEAPPVEYSRTGGDQCRAREIQLTYPGGCKPDPA